MLEDEDGEVWVELKSLRMQKVSGKVSAIQGDGLKTFGGTAVKKTLGKFFGQKYKKSGYNKQFNLDRVATTIGAFTNKKDDSNSFVKVNRKMQWWFQEFSSKRSNSNEVEQSHSLGSATDKRSIKKRLTDLPKTKGIKKDGIKASFKATNLESDTAKGRYASYIDLFNAFNVLIDQLDDIDSLEPELESLLTSP